MAKSVSSIASSWTAGLPFNPRAIQDQSYVLLCPCVERALVLLQFTNTDPSDRVAPGYIHSLGFAFDQFLDVLEVIDREYCGNCPHTQNLSNRFSRSQWRQLSFAQSLVLATFVT